MADDRDPLIRKLLSHPTATEARSWLARDDAVSRTLGESDSPERSRDFIRSLYDAGAVSVIATEIDHYEREVLAGVTHHESTGDIVIELPTDPVLRKRVFRIHARVSRGLGFDPTPDEGQRYLYCMLD